MMPVIITETWPEGYNPLYEGYIYNYQAFVLLQPGPKTSCRTFYAVDPSAKSVLGKVHFFKECNENGINFHSPLKSPFGSFELPPQCTTALAEVFVQSVLNQLNKEQPDKIHILHHASIYQAGNTRLIKDSLLKAGFRLNEVIPNHHILIDRSPLETKMHIMEKRRWRKCQKAGFTFREDPLSALTHVYDFVLACREERGWSLSMNLDALQNTVAAFPENYKLFSVYDGVDRIATTVAIVVNSRILYNFYPASLQSYQSYSPTVMLILGLYQYCQEKGMEILDLGTSASQSLRCFKEHMGGEVSYKYAFVYQSGK